MIHLFILAYAARPARVLNSRLEWERRGRIASGMGELGATGFRAFSSGDGRETALADAEDGFSPGGPRDRRAGLVALSSLFLSTSMLPKSVFTSRGTRPETAVKMRRILGQASHFVSFCLIHFCLFGKCDACVVGVNAEGRNQGGGRRTEDGNRCWRQRAKKWRPSVEGRAGSETRAERGVGDPRPTRGSENRAHRMAHMRARLRRPRRHLPTGAGGMLRLARPFFRAVRYDTFIRTGVDGKAGILFEAVQKRRGFCRSFP